MISIITPAFNAHSFIEQLVSSVLAQTSHHWEWIIVNDGSTDGTAGVLDSLSDPRIHVVHQENAGVSAARNVALDLVRGDYVTFLDADDILPPGALQLRAGFLDSHPDVDIVNGGVLVTSDGQQRRHYKPDLTEGPLLARLARLEQGVFFGVNYMIRRSKIGEDRFPSNVSHCEDLIFFLTLAQRRGLNYGAVDGLVYEYRLHPTSAMSDLNGLEAGYLELTRRTAEMPGIDSSMRRIQMRRVRRVLFRSWLRHLRPHRALLSLWKLRRLVKAVASLPPRIS